jgi:hypothetical protein
LVSAIPVIVYKRVPVVLLVGADSLVVKNAEKTGLNTAATATLGGTICVGYLPMMVTARPVFEATASSAELARIPGGGGSVQQITAVPELTGTVLQARLIYPLLFGEMGPLLAAYQFSNTG